MTVGKKRKTSKAEKITNFLVKSYIGLVIVCFLVVEVCRSDKKSK